MSDLADFLLARIAEDEDGARRGLADSHSCHDILGYCCHDDAIDGSIRWYGYARVLAECAAKRSIVQLHAFREDHYTPDELLFLAAVYYKHPDWREGWRA